MGKMAVQKLARKQNPDSIILDYQNRADDYAETHHLIRKTEKVKRVFIFILVGTLSLGLFVFILSRISRIG
jgi:CheY-like chemotaxis protein